MKKGFSELEQSVRFVIDNSQDLTLKSSKINEQVEKYIHHTLKMVQEKYGRGDLLDLIYIIVKELTINGIKANQKRIFFEERGLDLNSATDYAEGITAFKQEFSQKMNDEYGEKARKKGVYVQIFISFNEKGLLIEVENNSPITPLEENQLRENMKKSLRYNDLAEYYMDNIDSLDDTEGAGLGIALILMLLKGKGLNPNLFKIFTLPDRTIARVEFPFT